MIYSSPRIEDSNSYSFKDINRPYTRIFLGQGSKQHPSLVIPDKATSQEALPTRKGEKNMGGIHDKEVIFKLNL